MLNVFISLRTKGLTYEEAIAKRDIIAEAFKKEHENYRNEINIIESLFKDYDPEECNPIEYLGKSISAMKDADVVLIPLIESASSKGCACEFAVAKEYGIPIKVYATNGLGDVFFIDWRDTHRYVQ